MRVNEVSVLTPPRWVKNAARFKATLVALGWKKRHDDTDCAIVAVKDKFGRSRNGALDQGEL